MRSKCLTESREPLPSAHRVISPQTNPPASSTQCPPPACRRRWVCDRTRTQLREATHHAQKVSLAAGNGGDSGPILASSGVLGARVPMSFVPWASWLQTWTHSLGQPVRLCGQRERRTREQVRWRQRRCAASRAKGAVLGSRLPVGARLAGVVEVERVRPHSHFPLLPERPGTTSGERRQTRHCEGPEGRRVAHRWMVQLRLPRVEPF